MSYPMKTFYFGAVLLLAAAVPMLASAASVQIVSVSPTGTIPPGTQVSFIASASGFGDPTYALSDAFTASGATSGTIDKVGYFTWTPSIYDAGDHAITVTVTDALNHAASSTVSIRVASTVVLLSNLSPGPIVSVSRPVTFSLTAPGFTSPTYTVYDSSWRSSVTPANTDSTGTFTWKPNADDIGVHTLTINASDRYGHQAQTSQTITVVNPALAIGKLSPGSSIAVGSPVSFVASAGMLATSTTYAVTDSFTGSTTIVASSINRSGVFTWVPAASDVGLHTLTVTVTDGYANTASGNVDVLVTKGSAASAVTAAAPVATAPTPTAASATTAAVPTASAASYMFTKTIAVGSRGAAVSALQSKLKALGFYTGAVTGYFGPMTAASVKKFQKANGLSQVGSVGPGTRAVLNK